MKLDLQTLNNIYPNHIWQSLTPSDVREPKFSHAYSNLTGRSHADLNHLCLHAFFQWGNDNLDPQPTLQIWPDAAQLPSIWDVVTGTAIACNQKRFVLLPSEDLDTESFTIPQEWIDIPNWVADYYLPFQVNREAGWIHGWGYATHRTIKQKGQYDPLDRTYLLERDDLISDVNLLGLASQTIGSEKVPVPPLISLSSTQIEPLLTRLSQRSPYSPRLILPFAQWAAIIANDTWRQQLYQQRLNSPRATNLWNWLQQNWMEAIQDGWQSINHFLAPEQLRLMNAVRSVPQGNSSEQIQLGKLIKLNTQLSEIIVVLRVAVTPELEDKLGVLMQIHPGDQEKHLPPNLHLSLLINDQVIQSVSRPQDAYVEFPYLKCSLGTRFQVQLRLGNTTVTEEFEILQDVAL